MSAEDEDTPPPLPAELRAALGALRAQKPSPALRSRLQAALERSERAPIAAPARAAPVLRGPGLAAGVLMGAVLLGALVLRATGERGGDPGPVRLPAREVAFRLPGNGAGWLELPWTHDVHSGAPATVQLETSPPLDFLLHPPALARVGCDEARCVHEFIARTGAAATPLRVRIDRPGRYEFRVSHASDLRHVQEHFVVVAAH
ncbi:hypothetical protein LXT21_38270 [Myxococcus sp. K38C18041901]|uniref:hypothetical protein n=1 Tax=Myxococcus guangdongensis TaxID=2906760 RepID=UPI0020A71D9D|nr:hypothetical protein [Myxococcus guangdongensis]MCP3064634.1 hypothetical protein [Myxococcus guangdongensis]